MGRLATVVAVAVVGGLALFLVLGKATDNTTKDGAVAVTPRQQEQVDTEKEEDRTGKIRELRERLNEAKKVLSDGRYGGFLWIDNNAKIDEAKTMAEAIKLDMTTDRDRDGLGEEGEAILKEVEDLIEEATDARRLLR